MLYNTNDEYKMIKYFASNHVEKTHDNERNEKIKFELDKLNNANNIKCNEETIHIFLDNNYFNNACERFVGDIDGYLNKQIKIYFIRESKIIEYTNALLLTTENVSIVEQIIDVQKEIHNKLSNKDEFYKFIVDGSIKHYVMYGLIL